MNPTRTMHLYMDGLSSHKILDSDKKTVLYRTRRNLRGSLNMKPDVHLYRADPATGNKSSWIGDVTFRSYPCVATIKTATEDTLILSRTDDKLRNTLRYTSLRSKAGEMSWEAGDMAASGLLIDSQNFVVAKLERIVSWKKFARFHVYVDEDELDQELMDEILFTGTAMYLYLESRSAIAHSSGGAESAAGATG